MLRHGLQFLSYFLCLPFLNFTNSCCLPRVQISLSLAPFTWLKQHNTNKSTNKKYQNPYTSTSLCLPKSIEKKIFYTYPSIGGLPNNLPYSSPFLCRHSKYKMKYMKIEISLFVSFFLGSHNWVFVLATHHLFQSLLTHPLNATFFPNSPFYFSTYLVFSLFNHLFFLFERGVFGHNNDKK